MCLILRSGDFKTDGAANENERCPNVLVSVCGIRGVLESEEELVANVPAAKLH